MGKRNKGLSAEKSEQEAKKSKSDHEIESNDVDSSVNQSEIDGTKQHQSKKKNHKNNHENHTILKTKPMDEKVKKKKSKSGSLKTINNKTDEPKKIIFVDDEPQEVVRNVKTGGTGREKPKIGISSKTGKSKKTLFVDGEPQDIPVGSNQSKKKKNKAFLNDDEAEVKDEDIDKFCDELDEEDDKQFHEWVKLLEAKMHSK